MSNLFTSSAFTPLVFEQIDEEESALCAWCIREKGETPNERDSHGVCRFHADQMYASAVAGRESRRNRRNR